MSAIDFEAGVKGWLLQAFGPEISRDMVERCDRFVEEALELAQSVGYDLGRVAALVAYTDGRPKGDKFQEVGGVMVTLAALCSTADVPMMAAAVAELERIRKPSVMAQIRLKQADKAREIPFSPLPQAPKPFAWAFNAGSGYSFTTRKPDAETVEAMKARGGHCVTLYREAPAASEDDRILWGVVAHAGRLSRRRKTRWAHVMDSTGLGSTKSADLCARFGFNPEDVL